LFLQIIVSAAQKKWPYFVRFSSREISTLSIHINCLQINPTPGTQVAIYPKQGGNQF
jgi:hypothetical protein